jgi:anti-sigma B factor antagonist
MTTKPKRDKAPHRLKPAGEMTIYNAVLMKSSLMEALGNHKEMVIDLAEVSEIDSAGLQLLLLAKREADSKGKTLRLINHSGAVVEIFNLYHLAENFEDLVASRKTGA